MCVEMYIFVKNGIKLQGERKLTCKWYYLVNREHDTVFFHARDYCDTIPTEVCMLPGVHFRNDTDSMTDYFDKDSFKVAKKDNKKLFKMLLPFCM